MQFEDLLTDTQTKYSDQTKYVQKNTNRNNYNTIPIKIYTQKLKLKQKVTIKNNFCNKRHKTS